MPASPVDTSVALAASHGVVSTAPVVLRDGSNVLVHLAPTPVVARVASLTAEVRPDIAATLAKDVALAAYLSGRGVPVVPPSGELPAGPHAHAGRTVTFWTYVEHDRDHVWRPERMGPLLAELHTELRAYPGEPPGVPPLDAPAMATYLRSVGEDLLSDSELDDLTADAWRVTAEIAATGDEPVPLHGDAHPGNLLHTAHGPVWTDFEDAWRGPVGWDLACLARTGRLDGLAAVASYPDVPADLGPYLAARRLQSVGWELVFLRRFPTAERRAGALAVVSEWRDGR